MRELRWTEEFEEHIWRHYVLPKEVEDVVASRPRLVSAGRDGTTLAGRHLLVVLAEALDGRFAVVTARPMTPGERRTFRKRAS